MTRSSMPAEASLLTPFIIIGSVGLLLLIVSLVLGDVFDNLDFGDGAISGTALGVAAIVFGASGVFTVPSGLGGVWVYVLAAVFALIAYALAVLSIRKLSRSSDGTPVNTVGLTGVSRSPISPAGGEVSLDGPHEIERRLAYADGDIPEGVRIRVIEHGGTRIKVVAE
ncbi:MULTISPECIES: NfeD family protein [unclassified Microbacterium]|uniref:NfeD family protein n=1 Tax=unclassified Microbacterium TaxID=2609290 RepID=UPI00214BC714|nr:MULTISPECIES: NfeD family protein [unclassified Microbacterium]MCR2783320.1 NfeD family protein [Microbacterium sp. zg.B96]WIM15807.1 NfeD family protein [Microbacterium sp. zg-B96]